MTPLPKQALGELYECKEQEPKLQLVILAECWISESVSI